MKHPALTRVFSIVLCVFCLVMALAGVLGLSSNDRDRQKNLDDLARLQGRLEDYRQLSETLRDGDSYDQVSAALDARQSQHDEDAARHRSELATYTATQGGIAMGVEALDEADILFAQGKAKYEQGRAAFDAAYALFQQAKETMALLWSYYQSAMDQLGAAEGYLASAQSFEAALSGGEELTRGAVVSAYDNAVAAVDQGIALLDTVRELSPQLDAIAAMTPQDITQMAGMMEAGVELPVSAEELTEIKTTYDEVWARVKELIAEIDRQNPQVEQAVVDATGMTFSELRAQTQAQRDALAARDPSEPLPAEQQEALRFAYEENSAVIRAAMIAAGSQMEGVAGTLAELRALLESMQAQIDRMDAAMEKGKAAMDQAGEAIQKGGDELYWNRALIWYQMGQQEEKAEELRQEKEELEAEAKELESLDAEAKARKEQEQRLNSLRLMLLDREEIQDRVDQGMSLPDAGEAYARDYARETERVYQLRRLFNILMLAGAVFAFAALPTAFEALRSRVLFALPVLLCLGCALGVEGICRYLGRGDSYSALAAAGFALILLLVGLPRKKQRPGKHMSA